MAQPERVRPDPTRREGGDASRTRPIALPLLLLVAMTASTFAVPAVSVLSGFLIADLGISRTQLGWLITGTAAATAALATTGGRLTDRLGGRTMLVVLFATTLVAMAVMAAAPAYWVLMVAVVVAGFPNAAGNPATNKLVIARAPAGARGTVIGIKQSGVPGGIFLAGVALPSLAMWLGWRGAIAVTMVLPLLGIVAALLVLPPDRPTASMLESQTAYRHASTIRWLACYAFLMGSGGAGIISFLPLYANEALGFSVTAAGAAASILGLVGVPARIVWARRVDRSGRHREALAALAAVSFLAALAILLAQVAGPWLLWVGVLLGGMTVAAWNAVTYLTAVTITPEEHAGRATGLVMLGFMAGFTLVPALVGWTVDVTGSYLPAWLLVAALFAVAAALTVVWGRLERLQRTNAID